MTPKKVVLITGGASGIGKLMAEKYIKKNHKVIVWDINPESIHLAKTELSVYGEIEGYTIDISDKNAIIQTAELVKKEHGFVSVLINNAGIVVGKYFQDHTDKDIERSMQINSLAPMYITQAFLPEMISRNEGAICNIASSAGLISNPKMSVYCASKWAVIGWSDSLRIEMEMLKKNISVTTVTPYYINTGMFDGVKSIVPILKPEKVANKIIQGISQKKIFVSMPWSVGFVRFFQGLLPIRFFDWFVGKKMKVYHTMDEFVGRK